MLQIKIFTLRFSDAIEGFLDQEALNAFMSDKEIVDVREEFFIKGNIPYLSVIIKYMGVSSETFTVKEDTKKEARKDEYSSILTEESRPLFNILRQWRNERAKKDKVPPYVLFTNKELAEISVKSPETLVSLSTVEGVGKAKIEKYGKDVLKIVNTVKDEQKKSILPEKPLKEAVKAEVKSSPNQKQASLWEEDKKKDCEGKTYGS